MRTIYSEKYEPEAVILCSGDYPSHPIPSAMLHDATRVVCCDSAAFEYVRREGLPWCIVGDCDSILSPTADDERRILERCRHLIIHVAEQESNDLTKAVRHCKELGIRRLAIVGATGKREDHTMGNISLTIEYLRMGMEVRIYTDHGIFIPCRGDIECHVHIPEGFMADDDHNARRMKSTQISIFNISAKHYATCGLRYPFAHLGNWWEGTLNEAVTSPFSIQADGEFILYVNYA